MRKLIHRRAIGAVLCSSSLLGIACSASDTIETTPEALGSQEDELFAKSTKIWSSPHIPVCWEAAGNATEKQWIRDALANSWEAETNVSFEGWGTCTASAPGLHISLAEQWPQTLDLGSGLNKVTNGVQLGLMATPAWCTDKGLTREFCVKASTVHEFGHALGFAHEQNRADTPNTCGVCKVNADCGTGSSCVAGHCHQGEDGDQTFGVWDGDSVMNYCRAWTDRLSATDIAGAQHYYGGPRSVALESWGPNRLDVAVAGFDQLVWHKGWNGSAWSSFSSIGGNLTGSPSIVSWATDRIDVAIRGTDSHLYHKAWNGSSWSSFNDLGGDITGTPTIISRGVNLLDIFARGTNGHLYYKSWNGSTWSGFVDLGGDITGTPGAVSWGTNRLDVVARTRSGTVMHRSWNGTSWSAIKDLGGSTTGSPSITSWGTNRLDVVVRGTNGTVWHQATADGGTTWSTFSNIGGSVTGSPTIVTWGANRLDVVARGTDGAIWHQAWNGSAWSTFSNIGGSTTGSPSIVTWGSNRLDIVVRGTNGSAWHQAWAGSWSGFSDLGGTFR